MTAEQSGQWPYLEEISPSGPEQGRQSRVSHSSVTARQVYSDAADDKSESGPGPVLGHSNQRQAVVQRSPGRSIVRSSPGQVPGLHQWSTWPVR